VCGPKVRATPLCRGLYKMYAAKSAVCSPDLSDKLFMRISKSFPLIRSKNYDESEK
jgi:hypothetical protein